MHSPTSSDKVFILSTDVNQNNHRMTIPSYLNLKLGYEDLDSQSSSTFIQDNLCRRKQNLYFFVYVSVYVTFLVAGSWFFIFIELPEEMKFRKNLDFVKSSFIQKHPEMKGNLKCGHNGEQFLNFLFSLFFSEHDLEEFIKVIVDATNQGISPMKNASNELNWSFGQSFLFSTTLITTIGK